RLRADLVLAVEQVAPLLHAGDHAFVTGALPAHEVADDGLIPLALRVTQDARAIGRFHQAVAAMAGDHAAVPVFAHASSASAHAAHSKSVSEMPWSECVLKRTTHLL